MDLLVSMGIAAVLESLSRSSKVVVKAAALAKLFVALERAAEANPTLAAAIENARAKP